jgi:hypothetical protein
LERAFLSELKQWLRIDRITNEDAKRLLAKHHPLGAGQPCKFAFGVFWRNRCEGVITFGNPITNNALKCLGLCQHEGLELRKMWMSDVPPKNAESRALAIVAQIIRKTYPALQTLITYCDSDEKAVGYRAAGWQAVSTNTYIGAYKINNKWLTARQLSWSGHTRDQATEVQQVSRTKYVLALNASIAEKVKRLTTSQETAVPARPVRSRDQLPHESQ